MKRVMLCLMAVLLLLHGLPAAAEAVTDEEPELLTVGHTTWMSGNFFNHIFGNNTADIDVQSLLHGYYLTNWANDECIYAYDPMVVRSAAVSAGREPGSRRYTITLWDDLFDSEKEQITAYDYAFSILLSAAPQIRDIGGNVNDASYIVGMDAFKAGETDVLAGVRVKDPLVLEIEVQGDYLQYFYELGLLNFCPMPIRYIAPECEVADDGYGVYIRDVDTDERPSTHFTAELLQKTLLDPENGFVSQPVVSTGPYVLDIYDAQEDTAYFHINPYYKGDPRGQTPSIDLLIYRHADNETVIDELKDGTLDLFNKATREDVIEDGFKAMNEGTALSVTEYPRIGYSFIAYCWEQPAMKHKAVRQAIAYCMDADEFVRRYVGGFGQRVYGYYGVGQWMYRLVEDINDPPISANPTEQEAAAYLASLPQWAALSLDRVKRYDINLAEAQRLLVADGWTLNAEGLPYDAARDAYRCKLVDDELVALDLRMICPEGNLFYDVADELFIENLAKIGVRLELRTMPFTELLRVYYREVERDVDMIYLATNFTEVFEPSNTFDPADAMTHHNNRTACDDEELYWLSVDLRKTTPGDLLEYCTRWVAFQERYAEVLPTMPIYSNMYFDFYTPELKYYAVSQRINWTEAIVGAKLEREEEPLE